MEEQSTITITPRKLIGLVVAVALFVLAAVLVRDVLHTDEPKTPFADSTGAPGGEAVSGQEAFNLLLGAADIQTDDVNARNKSLSEAVVLHAGEAEFKVTPQRLNAVSNGCRTGSLVSVDVLVEPDKTSAVSLNNFALLDSDGTALSPIPECSTGFGNPTGQRTVAFETTRPDRLVIGLDPARPVAIWHL
ncbi:hypothetical protein [Paractinoplanes durhamensis]|uniref:Secreted protein n=1 Tax=Paractinoplanes durhamensis TaxID=113563 RepID=A0ABQ3YWY1_9ACTN|nr:hypothetical protein [Actinoplanes durhamensis]GIE02062.1 hypothetical protein Adu01nite_34120 [Actinoplanes durhamensis]